ncbi:MAG: hypothetical protein LAP21_08130 [Acidobacteriia bacterium]|nr:hypothetical protein [Terriglobia bacterium]
MNADQSFGGIRLGLPMTDKSINQPGVPTAEISVRQRKSAANICFSIPRLPILAITNLYQG